MDPIIIYGAAGILVLLLVGFGIALFAGGGRGTVDERLEEYVSATSVDTGEPIVSLREEAVAEKLDRALAKRGFTQRIKTRISKADVKLRVSEYIAFQFAAAVAGGFAFVLLINAASPTLDSIIFAVGAFIGSFVPRIYVGQTAKRRLRLFEGQLSDTLNLWVNALRSGYSILQAMEAIATELPAPVSAEFERVVQEVRLGLSVPQALENMLRRVPSEDLDLVVTAVNIQREVGGNLAEVLDTISFTIRERVRIKGEIRTLTAQGRLSGWIISFLPIALGFVLFLINRDYVSQLWINEPPKILNLIPCGWIVMAVGLIMMGIGMVVIQKIVDIEV
ncbi:MAG: type II secretion system F family protein [Chloroflexi bacterium]|nr:type II secretion system F family protein [Chloroflexota bacterium]MCI0578889.1 type II secretion system F family protein [Chloroflexota bacterium]MCI0649130.1 type II secretion system F family protein [Chloroflexota bacterium]MCI0727045.1 type II secretion system F family protein [Chloroflexota bacterium]